MKIRPIELKVANEFIIKYHRHHYKVQGHKFSIGCFRDDKLVGVAVCGRPISRYLDNGLIIEVTRLCSDGTQNVCSKLYSACARIAKEIGYNKIITYILENEKGISLRGSGWILEDKSCGGKKWKRNDGIRFDEIADLFGTIKKYPNVKKQRWCKILNKVEGSAK